MPRVFKQLFETGRVLKVFCAGRLIHPVSIELFALSGGYDGFWIDVEHAGVSIEQIVTAGLAARANGLGSFVRMPMTGYAAVTQVLESGVDGVMAAQVHSADEAEQFVRWAKFAPRGVRGLNTQGADAQYTHKTPAQLAHDANRDHFVAIQIETAGALAAAEAIAALPDVDLLFIGPSDLSQALGVLGELNHERVWQGITQVAAACRRHHKPWGIVPFSPDCAARCVELGCRMLTIGNDVLALRLGIAALRSTYAAWF
jgi:2-dehydro-3-deoxyglucarate aldolase/4-hydroxy-2-oxoheptanedioate aldolase